MWKAMRKFIVADASEETYDIITPSKIEIIEEESTTVKSTPVPKRSSPKFDSHDPMCLPKINASTTTTTATTKTTSRQELISHKYLLEARNRTPMGSYIVPEGEKPLTRLGEAYPGPSDYQPKMDLMKKSSPHYSLVGKPKVKEEKKNIPGPFNYNTAGDIIWKNKKISLKSRVKSHFDKEAEKSISLLGKYKVEHLTVGKSGPKFKMGTRTDSKIQTGPANKLVQPADTKGFYTPGPNYRPNSSFWGRGPKKSFGDRLKAKDPAGPGPADYDVQATYRGPSHSFGIKLPELAAQQQAVNKDSPAANTYDIGTTVGKAPAISIAGRNSDIRPNTQVPCPTSYTPEYKCSNDRYRAVTLTYRWFDSDEKKPGPADYDVKHANLKSNPKFTCRKRVKTSYPDTGTFDKAADDTPGPAAYNPVQCFSDNEKPSYSIGKRLECHSDKKTFPGPNAYVPEKREKPGSKKAPSFSMAKRLVQPNCMKDNPGPGEYSLSNKIYESEKGKCTIGSRRTRKETYVNPVAPNVYTLPELMSGKNKGVAFKSRASPYVYSGFRSNKIEEPRLLPPIAN